MVFLCLSQMSENELTNNSASRSAQLDSGGKVHRQVCGSRDVSSSWMVTCIITRSRGKEAVSTRSALLYRLLSISFLFPFPLAWLFGAVQSRWEGRFLEHLLLHSLDSIHCAVIETRGNALVVLSTLKCEKGFPPTCIF